MSFVINTINIFLTEFGLSEEISKLLSPLIMFAACFALLYLVLYFLLKAKKIKKSTFDFYLFISPWLIGFVVLVLWPILYSFQLSFTKWDIVNDPEFIGLANYREAFFEDPSFYKSLLVTFEYTFISVPLQMILAFGIAMLMNQKIKGISIFRTIFYLPSLVSGVALSVLWIWILHPNFGLLNHLLAVVGIQGPNWLGSETWALPSLIMMSLWTIGGGMVIYLAGLQDIPISLYESAEIDGAKAWHKFRYITLPMMTPIIFFNLITSIIGSFQTFTQGYVMTEGGPNDATLFYVLKLYYHAFSWFEMGYASALAWILFVIILVFTLIIFRSSALWVFYENEVSRTNRSNKKKGKRNVANAA